jgi:hypothetical protein
MLQPTSNKTALLLDSGYSSQESVHECNGLQNLSNHNMRASGPSTSRKSDSCPTTPSTQRCLRSVPNESHTRVHRLTSTCPSHSKVSLIPRPASAKKYQAKYPGSYSLARQNHLCHIETSVSPDTELVPVPETDDHTSLKHKSDSLNNHCITECTYHTSASLREGVPTHHGAPTGVRIRAHSVVPLSRKKPRSYSKALSTGETDGVTTKACLLEKSSMLLSPDKTSEEAVKGVNKSNGVAETTMCDIKHSPTTTRQPRSSPSSPAMTRRPRNGQFRSFRARGSVKVASKTEQELSSIHSSQKPHTPPPSPKCQPTVFFIPNR